MEEHPIAVESLMNTAMSSLKDMIDKEEKKEILKDEKLERNIENNEMVNSEHYLPFYMPK